MRLYSLGLRGHCKLDCDQLLDGRKELTLSSQNNHEWGDLWNGEDLSIYSVDDRTLPLAPSPDDLGPPSMTQSTVSLNPISPSYSQSRSSNNSTVSPDNLKATLKTPSIASQRSHTSAELDSNPGYRAAEAYVRPSPVATVGHVSNYGFDLRHCVFIFTFTATTAAEEDAPTEIFLPEYHFPRTQTAVEVSGGKWSIDIDDVDGGTIQRLRWWHGEGEQTMTIRGVKRRQGMALSTEDEEGYLQQCQKSTCAVM